MKILVCIKQVPDTSEIKVNPSTQLLIRSGVSTIVNPFDKNALEVAVQFKEQHGGTVTVLTMGPTSAKNALVQCLAVGGDIGVLISDASYAGSDSYVTSLILATAIKKLGHFDLILCGQQSIDGETAQVGPALAEHLDITQLTGVQQLVYDASQQAVTATLATDQGAKTMVARLPLLCTVTRNINQPRFPTISSKSQAKKMPITQWSNDDLALDTDLLGLAGSPTQVSQVFPFVQSTTATFLQADTTDQGAENLAQLIQHLTKEGKLHD